MSPRLLLAALLAVAASFPASPNTPARAKGFSFDPATGLSNRFVTPNNDGKNDVVVFSLNNPRDSALSGRIFDLKGAWVADMTPGPSKPWPTSTLIWDGKTGGTPVRSGVYIYAVTGDGQVYCGTVVVIL